MSSEVRVTTAGTLPPWYSETWEVQRLAFCTGLEISGFEGRHELCSPIAPIAPCQRTWPLSCCSSRYSLPELRLLATTDNGKNRRIYGPFPQEIGRFLAL